MSKESQADDETQSGDSGELSLRSADSSSLLKNARRRGSLIQATIATASEDSLLNQSLEVDGESPVPESTCEEHDDLTPHPPTQEMALPATPHISQRIIERNSFVKSLNQEAKSSRQKAWFNFLDPNVRGSIVRRDQAKAKVAFSLRVDVWNEIPAWFQWYWEGSEEDSDPTTESKPKSSAYIPREVACVLVAPDVAHRAQLSKRAIEDNIFQFTKREDLDESKKRNSSS
jgi:hypothetical protein